MLAGPSKCSAWVMLGALLLAGSLPAEETPPQQLGLYEGVVGGKLEELVEKSLLIQNPETMPNVTLQQVIARVEQLTKLQVWVDRQALTDAGLSLDNDSIISEWLAGETVVQLANRLSHNDAELIWEVHDGLAILTTTEKVSLTYETPLYPVGDLLAQGLDFHQLSEIILESTRGPWEVDEPGTGTLHQFGNLLFIRQTRRVHHEIVELLAILRRQDPIVIRDSSDEDVRVRRLLEENLVSFDWPGVPLGEFAKRLTELTGLNIRLNEKNLKDAGIDQNTRLDARAVNVPLIIALQKNLENVDNTELAVRVYDDVCHITTAEAASLRYDTMFYRLGSWGITGGDVDELSALLELETSGPWERTEPGTGTIRVVEPLNMLVIRQTYGVQREILKMLRDMRSKLARTKPVANSVARLSTPLDEPHLPVHTDHPLPETASSPAKVTRDQLTSVTWDSIGVYAPLLMALLLGCVAGYLGRH